LIDNLKYLDGDAFDQLCGLSGLNCHSLAMAMWLRVDGYIKFMPERLNITNTQCIQQTCVDVLRWKLQFLWEGSRDRENLLVTFMEQMKDGGYLGNDHYLFLVGGESVWTFDDRSLFVDEVYGTINNDCDLIALDSDAPSNLNWMNSNSSKAEEIHEIIALDRITKESMAAVFEAGSGIISGRSYVFEYLSCLSETNYHFRAVQPGSRAYKVSLFCFSLVHQVQRIKILLLKFKYIMIIFTY
jgi:hypothetical protein